MKNLFATIAITFTVIIGAALFTLSEGSPIFALILLGITTVAALSIPQTINKKNTAN